MAFELYDCKTHQSVNCVCDFWEVFPDSKVHGANMGPIWGRQDPGGPHVGPMNFAIWVAFGKMHSTCKAAKLYIVVNFD